MGIKTNSWTAEEPEKHPQTFSMFSRLDWRMDGTSGGVMEVAALGRPFSVGMLYDCRSDALVPGKNSHVKILDASQTFIF